MMGERLRDERPVDCELVSDAGNSDRDARLVLMDVAPLFGRGRGSV
jgi:hypothetical protein